MERLEERALNTFSNPPKLWLRFVDDKFAKLNENSINLFLEHLNEQTNNIQELNSHQRI